MSWLNDIFTSIGNFFTGLNESMHQLNEVVTTYSGEWWVLLAVFAFCMIDGFFPPIPSESAVVGLGAISVASGNPNLFVLILVAAAGAWTGDNLAYTFGRLVGTDRFAWMRRPKVQKAVDWAGMELRKRATSLILVARFIPIGRVAVNLTAGATHFPRKAFMLLTILSGAAWATYSVLIGAFAGTALKNNPLLGAAIGIVVAIFLGLIIDRVIIMIRQKREGPNFDREVVHSEAEHEHQHAKH